jgi:sugar lactone lactonase YvrE
MSIYRGFVVAVAVLSLTACSNLASSSYAPNGAHEQNTSNVIGAVKSVPRTTSGRVLYIADIDGQPGVGQILVYTADMHNPQFIRAITTGTGRPFGLWVDSKNILYVANEPDKYQASVSEFKPGASSPFFSITNFKGYPGSVAVDSKQNVYVNESVQDEGFVQVFAPGSNSPSRTIDTGIGGYAFDPGSMAFDLKGNLLVAEQARLQLHIVKIRPGSSHATPLDLDLQGNNITGPGMGVDAAGNIYVASSGSGSVSVFPPGKTEPVRTISPVAAYGLTWVTPGGAVFQASGESSVAEIPEDSNSPSYTLSCGCSAQGAAVSR